MNRYLIGILVVAGLGYWGYSWWQDRIKSETKIMAKTARGQALNKSLVDMALKANAVTNWDKNLAGGKLTRNSRVLTAELQKQWLIDRPILFVGNIVDIAMNQDGTYQLIVQYGIFARRHFRNDIRVTLQCPESVATPLIQAVRTKGKATIGPDTAVTGLIERIVTTLGKDSEGDTITVLTGVGKCINASYFTELIYQRD